MSDSYPLALPIGTVLAGQYVIERVLGQGGFGITYCAKDHTDGKQVAIKEYFPDSMAARTQSMVVPFTGDRGDNYAYGKECFLQEAETLAQFIGSTNIVRIYSYFEENGTAYFVMDYVEGTSFDEYIKQHGGKLSFEETYRILSPIMDALGIVHSRGIIHRDVTPDNIFITGDGTVKLLDFGAARYSLGDKSQSLDVVLKHGFAPKEQYARRGKQGTYTDIYALGATFYFALTGKRPPDSIERMDQDDLVAPSTLGVIIPDRAEKAILMALSVQPADRFQSMQAFKSAMGVPEVSIAPIQQTQTDNVQTTVQRFFDAPEPSGLPPVQMPVQSSVSAYNAPGVNQPVTGNPYQASSGTREKILSGFQKVSNRLRTLVESNFVIFKNIVAALFLIQVFLYLKNTDFQLLINFGDYDAITKTNIVLTLMSSIWIAVSVYKNSSKYIKYGLILSICKSLWFIVANQEETLPKLLNLTNVVIVGVLLAWILKKYVHEIIVYLLCIVLIIISLKGSFKPLGYVMILNTILLSIFILYRKEGENNGAN